MRIRSLLLASACTIFVSAPAHAVLSVTCIDCVTSIQWTIETAKEIENMVSQLRQMESIYGSLTGLTNVNSIGSVLSRPLLSNPLSSVTSSDFTGGLAGGSLSGLANQFRSADNLYLPKSGDGGFIGDLLNAKADMLANVKAAAATLFSSSQERIAGLNDLRAEIDQQPDLEHMQAINARIAAEETFISNQHQQLQQLALLANTQRQQSEDRERQLQLRSAQSWLDSTQPMGGN